MIRNITPPNVFNFRNINSDESKTIIGTCGNLFNRYWINWTGCSKTGMNFKNYYATLGISGPEGFDKQALRGQYHEAAKRTHPDWHQEDLEAEEKFKDVGEAFFVLNDDDRRLKYNKIYRDWEVRDKSAEGTQTKVDIGFDSFYRTENLDTLFARAKREIDDLAAQSTVWIDEIAKQSSLQIDKVMRESANSMDELFSRYR